jgi:arsenical pump membrane protein
MAQVVAFSILALTVSLSLSRPRLGRVRIHHSSAAVIGAILCVALGILPWADALKALRFLGLPVLTIVSLMTITLIAEQAGLFELLAQRIAKAANGSGKKLFAYLFFTGTLTGTVFTNDAAVLIFTPLVFKLVEQVADKSWSVANRVPFYFAVLYIANIVGAFVISNPINIIVCTFFHISFMEYASWMVLPALASILTTYFGLRYFFRNDIPESFERDREVRAIKRTPVFMVLCAAVLLLTLIGFFSEGLTGIPTWLTAVAGAGVLLVLHTIMARSNYKRIVKGIGWDVIVFVIGIFIVANGLRNVGLTSQIGAFISFLAGDDLFALMNTTGFTAAFCSSIMNNHPTADMMAMVIRDLNLSEFETRKVVLSALIGGDLGPKMLPIGSLAALLWFRILRDRGVDVSYWTYIRIGVPVTLAAVFLSILTLHLQIIVHRLLIAGG